MAQVTSSTYQASTYVQGRVVVTYSGTSATVAFQYLHTSGGSNAYTGTVTFTASGTSVSQSWSGKYIGTSWSTYATISVSISTSGSTIPFSVTSNGAPVTYSGSVLVPSQVSAPTGGKATLASRDYQTIVAYATVTSYGTPSSANGRYIGVAVLEPSATSYFDRFAAASTQNSLTTGNKTFSGSSYTQIRGCAGFKLGYYADNLSTNAYGVSTVTYYLPPAPLASVTVSTSAGTTATATVKITGAAADGASGHNASGAKVTTQYRLSTNNGSSYGSWTNVEADHTPGSTKTVTLTGLAGSTACKVQARQLNYRDTSQISAVTTTSFTTPATYKMTYNGSTVSSCTYNGSTVEKITLNGTTVWVK